jgi:putative tryptophan/tyrosine transport system substrate-binding protein
VSRIASAPRAGAVTVVEERAGRAVVDDPVAGVCGGAAMTKALAAKVPTAEKIAALINVSGSHSVADRVSSGLGRHGHAQCATPFDYRLYPLGSYMQRRTFITVLGGAAASAAAARAQQKAMPVVGFLGGGPFVAPVVDAFREELGGAGYVEGQNILIEYRWAHGRYEQLPALVADLVGRKVDVIVTTGGTPAALAAKNATSTIPIVFVSGDDPVERGLVASLARPGGNLTGISFLILELHAKRLQLLLELEPQIRAIALLVNPNFPQTKQTIRYTREAALAKELKLHLLEASTERQIDAAFETIVQLQVGAIVLGGDAFFTTRREQVVALASHHAIPTVYYLREFAAAGGLISYGASLGNIHRQAALYVAKLLNGSKPADLPVQQPTKFELVINLKTAAALGLTVPQSLLARADEVID